MVGVGDAPFVGVADAAFVGAGAAAALPILAPAADTMNQVPSLPCPLVSPADLSPLK